MIQLRTDIQPSQEALDKLTDFQREIDGLATFDEKSKKAKSLFSLKNKNTNTTFNEVKKCLTEMCNSTRRCVYCEDSFADEVEHIYPKDLYPEKCFDWGNYVYACGPCNGPKNNKFAVFRDSDGAFTTVNPLRGTESVEPPKGEAAFINPRIENPLDFAILDLDGSFQFYPLPGITPKQKQKAEYTYSEVLKLNHPDREPIRQARQNAYDNYKARLNQYVSGRKSGVSPERLMAMIESLKRENHPTVWKEMQRYYNKGFLQNIDSELSDLFDQTPEALSW